MFISQAYAQDVAADIVANAPVTLPDAPSAMDAFITNMGLVLVLVVLFYFLLIRPQQKRFKDHSEMLAGLQKGDRIITGGGLIGKVDKIVDDKEVVIDLGNGMKVSALRTTISSKDDPRLKPANDDGKSAKDAKTSDKKPKDNKEKAKADKK